jgi:putative inorganic carbon (hco3(-)) transporter
VAEERSESVSRSGFGFGLVVIYLVFEYTRPQDIVPVIGALRVTLILVPLMMIAWLKSAAFKRAASPQLTLMLWMLALLAVHVPFAVNRYFAYQEAENFLLLLAFCVSVIIFVDSRERLLSLLRWWVLLALYIAAKTIRGHGVAGSSFLGDPNDVSLLLNTMLPFVLCLLVYEARRVFRVAYVAIALACIAGIVVTASRGGFVGLLALMAVIWLMSPRKMLAFVLVSLMAVGVYQFAPDKYWNRIATIRQAERDESAQGRINSWSAAWEMFKDHPLGVGQDNFAVRFPEYQGNTFTHNMWGRVAHSLWFTLLAELGIPGALLYALLLRANWRSLWHLTKLPEDDENRRLAYLLSIAFFGGLAGFFASATFLSVLFYPHYWVLTAMIVATEKTLGKRIPAAGAPVTASYLPAGGS